MNCKKVNSFFSLISLINLFVVFLTTIYSLHKGYISEDGFIFELGVYAALVIIPAFILFVDYKIKKIKTKSSLLVSDIASEVNSYMVIFAGYTLAVTFKAIYNYICG